MKFVTHLKSQSGKTDMKSSKKLHNYIGTFIKITQIYPGFSQFTYKVIQQSHESTTLGGVALWFHWYSTSRGIYLVHNILVRTIISITTTGLGIEIGIRLLDKAWYPKIISQFIFYFFFCIPISYFLYFYYYEHRPTWSIIGQYLGHNYIVYPLSCLIYKRTYSMGKNLSYLHNLVLDWGEPIWLRYYILC